MRAAEPRRWPVAPTLAALAALLGLGMVIAALAGPLSVAPATLWRGLWEGQDAPGYLVVRDLRLPRILMAALVGAALASTGAALQGLFRNPWRTRG